MLHYAEESVVEDEVLTAARERAVDLGAAPIPPSVGAVLSVFAQISGARTVVEVGTGAGVSGLWLLDGMRADGVLTTIDSEPEHQRAAKEAFRAGGIAASRTRLINGRALDVLPRLADASYDMVFIDATPRDHVGFVTEGVRMLRPGGVLILHNALLGGRVADASSRDESTVAVRAAARTIAENDALTAVVLPSGDGLLCASKNPE